MELIMRLNAEWKDLSELFKANQGEELIRIKSYLNSWSLLRPSKGFVQVASARACK
jgi:hypothetical protein